MEKHFPPMCSVHGALKASKHHEFKENEEREKNEKEYSI